MCLAHPLALHQLAPFECVASLDTVDDTTVDLIPISWFRAIHTSSTLSVETVSGDQGTIDAPRHHRNARIMGTSLVLARPVRPRCALLVAQHDGPSFAGTMICS